MGAAVPSGPMEVNLARLHEAVAAAVPDRECIVWRDRRLTYADVTQRSRRLANVLVGRGLGPCRMSRDGLDGHQSHQDHLALYLHNGNEYLEAMLGAYKARVAPLNVNYRYVADELRHLLTDSGARGVVYHGAFAPTLAAVRAEVVGLELLLQVDDGSGHELPPGALDYEAALAAASPELPSDLVAAWSPDDLYILYTGGTTGHPKGVLWRQADIWVASLGGRELASGREVTDLEAVVANARNGGARTLTAAPFMHAAGHWLAFVAFTGGNTVVLPDVTSELDAASVWSTVEREQVNAVLIVGDAFARPLVRELDRHAYDLSALRMLITGGAPLSAPLKDRVLSALPELMIVDTAGASETGTQMVHVSASGPAARSGTFGAAPGAVVVNEDLTGVLPPGHDGIGWLAQRGRVPLGYLNDEARTTRTFPMIHGERMAVPGDRARRHVDGTIELLGRDSATVNSGGEKIFAEEVEAAIARHPDVGDVVVAARDSERWGQEVVAIVALATGATATEADLLAEAARHLARYKLPKAFVFVESVVRSPAGKADYRWARTVAEAAASAPAPP